MTAFNFSWLEDNFSKDLVIFDIGCAELADTIDIKRTLPNSRIYAFECNNIYLNGPYGDNFKKAQEYNINYYHMAVSDADGEINFYPAGTQDGVKWPWSSSTCAPLNYYLEDRWTWDNSYKVKSVTINTFCKQNNIQPDFIHVDAQGAEYKIFSSLQDNIRPTAIWAEISEFERYDTGVNLNEFNELMLKLGYIEVHRESCDSLYVLKETKLSKYIP